MFFIGAVLGKALCEGMLLDVPFAHFFLLKILSEVCFLNQVDVLFCDYCPFVARKSLFNSSTAASGV
jgi:hypothetical protein